MPHLYPRCRYRSVMDMVKSWHQEKQHYSFPHPRECNPRCPSKCSGSVCSHYTQVSTAASPEPEAKGGLVQLTSAAGIQDRFFQLPASDQAVVLAAGGMLVMPFHPGLLQHLGCCRKVPGVHNPAVTFWPVDMEVSNFFKAFFPLLWPFSPHCTSGNLKVVRRKNKPLCTFAKHESSSL